MRTITLAQRIEQLARRHKGLRTAARVIGIDHAYMHRLKSGEKTCPSDAVLHKLGLLKIVQYVMRKP